MPRTKYAEETIIKCCGHIVPENPLRISPRSTTFPEARCTVSIYKIF